MSTPPVFLATATDLTLDGQFRRHWLVVNQRHVTVLSETSLRRTIRSYLVYYHGSRTHLSLAKDTPERRTVQPPELGRVFAIPHLGGLHHRYERRAA